MDFEKLVAAAGDAVVAADPKGRIILWNAAAQRIFGFAPDEALGQSLDLIIPERLRDRHWQGYDKVMHSGETRYGAEVLRVPALRKDGRPISIAFTVTLLKRDDGTVESIVAILRDDTARWNEERALKKRLAELEAKARE
jgi:PAS domain S-box-containing protein